MKALLILLTWFICFNTVGQGLNLSTRPGAFEIEQSSIQGHFTILPYSTELVEKALIKYLREYGRTERMEGFFLTTDLVGVEVEELEILLFSKVESEGLRAKVWMGVDTLGLGAPQGLTELSSEVQNMLLNFGRRVHVSSLQNKIVQAEKDAVDRSRDYQKLLNQQATLERKVSFNEAERVRLEEALKANREEKVSLIEQSGLNSKLQNLATEELHKMNQKVDLLRVELSNFQQTF